MPGYLRPTFDASDRLNFVAVRAQQLAASVIEAQMAGVGMEEIDCHAVEEALRAVASHLYANRPYALCRECWQKGSLQSGCRCKGRGWLTLTQLGNVLDDSLVRKSMRNLEQNRRRFAQAADAAREFIAAGDLRPEAIAALPKLVASMVRRINGHVRKRDKSRYAKGKLQSASSPRSSRAAAS